MKFEFLRLFGELDGSIIETRFTSHLFFLEGTIVRPTMMKPRPLCTGNHIGFKKFTGFANSIIFICQQRRIKCGIEKKAQTHITVTRAQHTKSHFSSTWSSIVFSNWSTFGAHSKKSSFFESWSLNRKSIWSSNISMLLTINYSSRESSPKKKSLVISAARWWKVHGLVSSLDTHFRCELIFHISEDGKKIMKSRKSSMEGGEGKMRKEKTNKPQRQNKQERNFT